MPFISFKITGLVLQVRVWGGRKKWVGVAVEWEDRTFLQVLDKKMRQKLERFEVTRQLILQFTLFASVCCSVGKQGNATPQNVCILYIQPLSSANQLPIFKYRQMCNCLGFNFPGIPLSFSSGRIPSLTGSTEAWLGRMMSIL